VGRFFVFLGFEPGDETFENCCLEITPWRIWCKSKSTGGATRLRLERTEESAPIDGLETVGAEIPDPIPCVGARIGGVCCIKLMLSKFLTCLHSTTLLELPQ
jgi:hypothetical protein